MDTAIESITGRAFLTTSSQLFKFAENMEPTFPQEVNYFRVLER
jgi:hypothetical protein